MTSASHGEPTGNVISPIFHGFGFPLKASHGVALISVRIRPVPRLDRLRELLEDAVRILGLVDDVLHRTSAPSTATA